MVIRTDLPNPFNKSDLYELEKTYQIHRYLQTCRKCGNERCTFQFLQIFH